MTVVLSDETQKLLEERIREGGYASADDAVRAALEASEFIDNDPETVAAVERALEESEHSETYSVDEVRARLQSKGMCS